MRMFPDFDEGLHLEDEYNDELPLHGCLKGDSSHIFYECDGPIRIAISAIRISLIQMH